MNRKLAVGVAALGVAVVMGCVGARCGKGIGARSEALDASVYEKCGGPRIDYIYVSDGMKVLDYRTVSDPRPGKKLYPSDHFPVVATVELP
mgnify:CR=1 FL=1